MFGVRSFHALKAGSDPLSGRAGCQLAGAVNTVVNKNGILVGYITDGKGIFGSLPSLFGDGTIWGRWSSDSDCAQRLDNAGKFLFSLDSLPEKTVRR